MNAPVRHYIELGNPTWTERRPGVFDLRLNANATFLVVQEGARYEILLPGQGRVKAWTRNQVERLARDHHENPLPEDDDADDASGIPTNEELRRWYEGRVL